MSVFPQLVKRKGRKYDVNVTLVCICVIQNEDWVFWNYVLRRSLQSVWTGEEIQKPVTQ